jgi:hypothetical protein
MPARALTITFLATASLGLGASAGCSEESPGSVRVSYVLGFSDDCVEFGAVDVHGWLGERDDGIEDEQPCDPAGELFFPTVPAGNWTLRVEAQDALGITILDNGADLDSARVKVPSGGEVELAAKLTATPVELNVRWNIQVGDFPAQCNDVEVRTATFRVTAWDADGAVLVAEDFACDAPTAPGSRYQRLDDPDRLVRGSALRAVTVEPLDAAGEIVGTGPLRFEFDPPGAGRKKYFTVLCQDNACSVTGMPPYETE